MKQGTSVTGAQFLGHGQSVLRRWSLALALVAAFAGQNYANQAAAAEPVRKKALESMDRGLQFLLAKQNANGSFGVIPGAPEPGELGMTGLVVRTLATLPPTVQSEATQRAIDAAMVYVLKSQREDGAFDQPGSGLVTYRSAVAVGALLAVDAERYREQIERGKAYLAGSQFSEHNGLEAGDSKQSPYYGGWGYDRTGSRPDADISNTTFALEALRAAGLERDSEVWKRAVVFLRRCQNRSESNDVVTAGLKAGNDGGFMYDPGLDRNKSGEHKHADGTVSLGSYASVTYAGLLSMLHAHLSKDDARVKAAWEWIQRNYTLEENRGLGARPGARESKQGLFYYYLMFAKALDAWGESDVILATGEKRLWANDLCAKLASLQHDDGSWTNEVPRWWEADPVLVTTYVLQAYNYAVPHLQQVGRPAAGK